MLIAKIHEAQVRDERRLTERRSEGPRLDHLEYRAQRSGSLLPAPR